MVRRLIHLRVGLHVPRAQADAKWLVEGEVHPGASTGQAGQLQAEQVNPIDRRAGEFDQFKGDVFRPGNHAIRRRGVGLGKVDSQPVAVACDARGGHDLPAHIGPGFSGVAVPGVGRWLKAALPVNLGDRRRRARANVFASFGRRYQAGDGTVFGEREAQVLGSEHDRPGDASRGHGQKKRYGKQQSAYHERDSWAGARCGVADGRASCRNWSDSGIATGRGQAISRPGGWFRRQSRCPSSLRLIFPLKGGMYFGVA